jgi:phosphatidylglycerol:prolipoprotein diacylglycerol transferase
MHPILFRIGSYEVPAYGMALLLAFAAGLYVGKVRADRRGLDGERVLDVGMVIIVSSLVGSRLLYVVTHLADFRPPNGAWLDAVNPFQAEGIVGLSMIGGVALATVATLAWFAWKELPVLRYADLLAPSVALGEGITRIGCFLNGCCYGKPTSLPWAVHFPADSGPVAVLGHVAIHPTQLYASIFGFALFAGLVHVARRPRPDGFILALFFVLAGASRIGFEAIRYAEPEVIPFHLGVLGGAAVTWNQILSGLLVVAGAAGLVLLRRRSTAP